MSAERWSFGPYRFDAREYTLLREGSPISVQPKPLDLLARLLREPGALVLREELEQTLYPGVTVTSHALRNVVLKLREALGPEHEGWVETVPRKGVRFTGPVTVEGAPALPSGAARAPLHLPAERDRFVGRQEDLRALGEALDQARLVTVLGLGGVGKTRLALHYAWKHLERWPGGVWFCDLSDASSVETAAFTVARAMGISLGSDEPLAQLGRALAGCGRCLLVLDNLEHLAAQAQALAGGWLDQAPQLQILATSRELLQVVGERALDLGPLAPEDGAQLFGERARAADRRWTAPQDPAELPALVAMLDALPLAIELAAARVRVMPVADITARMGERFEVLKSMGGRVARHATLEATLDTSWALLTEGERRALAQMSVFCGAFSLQAAEGVLDAGAGWAVDLVQALADKSLVRLVPPQGRLELLASVREYAARRLEELGGREDAEGRHVAFFARSARARLASSVPDVSLELADLVSACRRATARGDVPSASVTLRAACVALERQGPFALVLELAEGVEALAPDPWALWAKVTACMALGRTAQAEQAALDALVAAEPGGDRALVVRLRGGLAWIRMMSGRLQEAQEDLQIALTELRASPDLRQESQVTLSLGTLSQMQGRAQESCDRYGQAIALARQLGDLQLECIAQGNLGGVLHHSLGKHVEAREHYEASLELARARTDKRQEGMMLGHLGVLLKDEARYVEAEDCYRRALALHRQLGHRREEGVVLGQLANLYARQQRWDEAMAPYEAALQIHREAHNRRFEAVTLANLGAAWAERGDPARAEGYYQQALALHREVHNRGAEANTLSLLAGLHRAAGERARARASAEAALQVAREIEHAGEQAGALTELALLGLESGDTPSAAFASAQAVALLRAPGHEPRLAEMLCVHAEIELAGGRVREARSALAEAAALAGGGEDLALRAEIERVRALVSR